MKTVVWLALRHAIARAGAPCETFGDGVTIPTGESDFEPDALVACGERLDSQSLSSETPTIVVEVLSPGTRALDTAGRLAGYFNVLSVLHYLIIHPDKPTVTRHRRDTETLIQTKIMASGTIQLDPPVVEPDVDARYEAVAV